MFKKIFSFILLFFYLFSVSFADLQSENTEDILKLEEKTEIQDFQENFQIKNKFQNPTYLLDKEIEKDEYFCDENKECKVNFDFRESFDEKFKLKDFSCEITFGEEKIENCNPNSITFENEETEIKIKIFNKKYENIFKERIIKILKKVENSSSEQSSEEEKDFGSGKTEEIGTGNINDGNGQNNQNSSETENNNQEETGSGEIENTELKNFMENFEIKNIFQRPTYLLDKDEEKEEYFCENEDDCKVNFDFRKSFSENFKEKDFSCEIIFGNEKIENCNPNSIEIKENTEIKIKIFNKKDENIFKERIIKFFKKDEITSSQPSPEGEGDFGSGKTEETGTGKIEDSESSLEGQKDLEKEELKKFNENFEIKNIFQNPTNLFDKEAQKDIYFCEKKDCKVNFDFRQSFSEIFKSKNFSCEVTFGNEIIKTCNPSTLDILPGNSEIFVKIFNKKDKNIFKEKKYIIKNEILNSNLSRAEIALDKPKIKVQSGILNGKCEKKDCKVNFIFETKNKNLACSWDFGSGEFKEKTEQRCNPSSVKFPYGKHFVKLKVYEKGNENNFLEDFFEFENDFRDEGFGEEIVLDGKSKEFQIGKNLAFCAGISSCKLNFSVKNILKAEKKYFWDFGNGETFEGKNPKVVEFKHGKYKISLKISDDKEEKEIFFYVIVDKNRKNFFEKYFKNEKIENKFSELKYRKNQENLLISGKNEKNIFIERRIDFPFIGKFIYDKIFFINIDENSNFKQNFDYDKPGKYIFDFYEIGENGEKKFKESKKIEITYKNYFLAKILEIEKEQKEAEKIRKKEEKEIKKKKKIKNEEEKFLKIIMQGKSTKNKYLKGKTIFCNGPCSINFGLETNIRGGKFLVWNLGNSEKFNGKNPKSKKYQVGNYKISVRYEDENGKVLEDFFEVKVSKKIKKKRKRKSKKGKVGPVNLVILVQGKLGKNKILSENKLICLKTCSVNFDGRKSSGAYKELVWDFGNGEKFVGENPKSVKYKEHGMYKVTLKTEDFKGKSYEKTFEVEFLASSSISGKDNEESKNFISEKIEEKSLKKDDIFFILIILFMISGFSLVLLRRYKII